MPALPQQYFAGDILAFYGRGWQSRGISLVTAGPSHVGIVADHSGERLLWESTTLCDLPCYIRRQRIQGVQAHLPRERVDTYPGEVYRYSLVHAFRLDLLEQRKLSDRLYRDYLGLPYNLGGAIASGTLLRYSHLLPYPDRGSWFCSQLVASCLQVLGRLPLADPTTFNPASLLRSLRRNGAYGPPERVWPGPKIAEHSRAA